MLKKKTCITIAKKKSDTWIAKNSLGTSKSDYCIKQLVNGQSLAKLNQHGTANSADVTCMTHPHAVPIIHGTHESMAGSPCSVDCWWLRKLGADTEAPKAEDGTCFLLQQCPFARHTAKKHFGLAFNISNGNRLICMYLAERTVRTLRKSCSAVNLPALRSTLCTGAWRCSVFLVLYFSFLDGCKRRGQRHYSSTANSFSMLSAEFLWSRIRFSNLAGAMATKRTSDINACLLYGRWQLKKVGEEKGRWERTRWMQRRRRERVWPALCPLPPLPPSFPWPYLLNLQHSSNQTAKFLRGSRVKAACQDVFCVNTI